ncbi:MAG TPA: neocarzinostatin apoprotein domain-containing protein [Acidimicrobiia bacterium]
MRVGLAACVATLVVCTAAPAFGDDGPQSTSEPSTTEPVTTTMPEGSTTTTTTTTATTATTAPDPQVPTADTFTPDESATVLAPSLTVTPSTGLLYVQSVNLAGSGFTANVAVGWAQCKNNQSGEAADCDTAHTGSAFTDGFGAFSSSFTARRMLHTANGDVDCAAAPGTCNIGSAKISDYSEHAGMSLTFDPNAPVPPPPVVTVTPNTGLLYLQSVTVAGSGFTPNTGVGWAECKNNQSGDAADCDTQHSGFATTDDSGAFSASFTARRILHTLNGDVDCAAAPGTCNIGAANLSDYSEGGGMALTFDPNAPIPPPPTLTVTPDTDLVDGQPVTVTGGDYPPNSLVVMSQCATATQPAGFCGFIYGSATTDANGAFTTTFNAHRAVYDFNAFPVASVVDCAGAPQLCSIVAFTGDRDWIASRALDFDPAAPISVPDVTVSPQTELTDGAMVHVHSTGFAAGERVLVQQCVADAPVLSTSCADNVGPSVEADGSGAIDTTVEVHRDLPQSDGAFILDVGREAGPVSCADAFGTCVIRARSLDDLLVVADVPIGFGPTPMPGPTEPPVDLPTRTLAFTGAGASTVPTAGLGFALLLVGGVLLLLARRRAAV